jgi:anti-anti-sigma regulatory factor
VTQANTTILKVKERTTTESLRLLASELSHCRGQQVTLDLSDVARPSTPLLQLIWITHETWRTDGVEFFLASIPSHLTDAMKLLGFPEFQTCVLEEAT